MSTDRVLPASEAALAPGFRFRPTDEELISYYLKRKVQGKPLALDLIGEVDVYKQEDPSHLPVDGVNYCFQEQSKMKTKDREWYFFTTLERHEKRGCIKRATTKGGYWCESGLEKEIKRGGGDDVQVVGKVRKFVFNTGGRPPYSQPTNWVIHEYHLVDNDGLGLKTDAYVLCRLSNNSENINAPFSEQEWDDVSGRALVPSLVLANETIQQESDSGSKNLFDLNELSRESDMNEDPKTVDQDDACLLPCVLNKEAHLPFIQYKRKRQIDYANSIQTTHQDHCSSPKTTSEATPSVDAAMPEESEPEPVDTTMVPTTSSYTEADQGSAEGETADGCGAEEVDA
ncbi:hypothetical protein Bca4012_024389 [Brassica carinata]